ncbi:TonB-dependent siderophore receptor [Lutibaculum baratangense]|uniref:Ferrichrome-iron receptor n=1 Tax=Lutibaculum baratangense AMV1 TaxID=631454 RepID=V4RMT2_9HYPH|nr:TonB-dependent siderophore receptor [Lutibaculum baratangense]ESR24520.1 Ferrichrome-iron receptor [Lutibaculum baratangense AMV1]
MSIVAIPRVLPAGGRAGQLPRLAPLLLGCTALVALVPASVAAQEGATVDLETIEVQAEESIDDSATIVATELSAGGKLSGEILDIPASVSVITSREIEQRGAKDVEQVLQYTAGVVTDFYGSDDRYDFFKIRGFDAYTYRDGLSLGSPFGNVREEPFAFDRVEVVRGASSTLFGVSDPGGMVNFVTKTPKHERFGSVSGTVGSWEHVEVGVDFGDNITADDTLSYRFAAKIQDSERYYDQSRDDEQFAQLGLSWRPSAATTLTVVGDYLNRDATPGSGGQPVGAGLNRGLFFGEPDFNYQSVERTTLNVMFDHDFGNGLSVHSNTRYSDAKTDWGYAYISGTVSVEDTIAARAFFANDRAETTFITDARLQYEATFGLVESKTVLGAEYADTSTDNATWWTPAPNIDWRNPVYTGGIDLSAISPFASTRTDHDNRAVYVQEELRLADRLILNAGLRYDDLETTERNVLSGLSQSGDFGETTLRAGATYKITPDLSAYASYAESAVPAGVGVEPELGEQYELGMKYRPFGARTLVTAAIYDLTKSNITRTDPFGNPSTIGEVRVRGVDLEAKAELIRNVSLTAAYSYMDAEIVENGGDGTEGNRPSLVPEHLASLWVNYTLEGAGRRGDTTFGLGARYTGSYFFDDANTQSSDSHVVLDANMSYEVSENTELALNVTNLLNEKHVAYGGFGADFYNPGRAAYLTLRHSW